MVLAGPRGAPTPQRDERYAEDRPKLEFILVAARALGQLAEKVERMSERLDRLLVREHAKRKLGAASVVRNRPCRNAGLEPMARQSQDVLLRSLFVELERLGGRPMLARALLGQDSAVDRLLDQHVLEPVLRLGPAAVRDDEAEPHELVKHLLQQEVGSHELREEREVEPAPNYGGCGEHCAALGRKAVGPREDHLPDSLGNHDRDRVVEAPTAPISLHDRPGIDERTHELLEVEGIAVCRLEHAALKLVGQGPHRQSARAGGRARRRTGAVQGRSA